MKRKKKVRPYKRYYKLIDIAAVFGYASPKAFYATSARDRILTAVDQIIRDVESRATKENARLLVDDKKVIKDK
jgi:hypothetical protein